MDLLSEVFSIKNYVIKWVFTYNFQDEYMIEMKNPRWNTFIIQIFTL